MYHYDKFDHQLTAERVAQFRDQVSRRLNGELKEDDFRVLRLQNGIYMQVHGYMMRIAIPYGLASSAQVHKLAHIARTYDRGYGHLSTRQNIQFNWLKLEDTPQILAELAEVEMHANQTSGRFSSMGRQRWRSASCSSSSNAPQATRQRSRSVSTSPSWTNPGSEPCRRSQARRVSRSKSSA